MNLTEAEKSYDYFAELLKTQSGLLGIAIDSEAKSAATEMAVQAIECRKQLLIDLKETRKNSLIIEILIRNEMTREAARLVFAPAELAKVNSASARLEQAAQQADLLI